MTIRPIIVDAEYSPMNEKQRDQLLYGLGAMLTITLFFVLVLFYMDYKHATRAEIEWKGIRKTFEAQGFYNYNYYNGDFE